MSTSLVSLASLVQAFNPVTPQLRVAAIIVRQTQILLVEHRKRGQRYWVLPGGRLEGHETLEAALRRELKESSVWTPAWGRSSSSARVWRPIATSSTSFFRQR